MEDIDDCQPLFQPIRRVSQACNFCRRRKARCSGHRPRCTNCRRLSLECEYACNNPPRLDQQLQPPAIKVVASDAEPLSTTLTSLRADMSQLQAQIQNIFETQQQIISLLFHQSRASTTSISSNSDSPGLQLRQSRSNELSKPEQPGTVEETLFPFIRPPTIELLVDIYFDYCHNQPYSFFHEGNFRSCMARQEIPDHLLLALVATTLRFSDNLMTAENKQAIAVQAATCSWRLISAIYLAKDNTDIRVAQTLALLSIFDFTAGKPHHNSAWIKIGIAIRLAQDMKLMLHPPSELSFEVQEERRRVFWSLYLLDLLASCGRGRPVSISESSCQLQLPCDEDSWKNNTPCSTATLAQLSQQHSFPPPKNSPLATVLLFANLLGRAARFMLQGADDNNNSSNVPPWDHRSELAALQSNLTYLEPSLSRRIPFGQIVLQNFAMNGRIDQPALGPLVFSQTLFHLCYCVLYHPFLLKQKLKEFPSQTPNNFLLRSFETGYENAKQLILHIDAAKAAGCRTEMSFYSYAAALAGSILIFYIYDASESVRFEVDSLQQKNVTFLEELGQRWNHTPTVLRLLQTLILNSHRFSSYISDVADSPPLMTRDEELMWTLLDYSAWSNLELPDVAPLSEVQTTGVWPDVDASLDGYVNIFS